MENKKFNYTFSELRRFIELGKKEGNVGMIPLSISNNIIKYKGFGTIEHPNTTIHTMSLIYDERFDEFNNRNIKHPDKDNMNTYEYVILKFDK